MLLRASAIITLMLLLAVPTPGRGETAFVHLTNPQIFADRKENRRNLDLLAAAVEETNRLTIEGVRYEFVVLTGDLGIASLGGTADGSASERLASGARSLGRIIGASRVPLWFLMPGESDLAAGKAQRRHYEAFLLHLAPASLPVKVVDFSKHFVGPFSFLAFDNSSFGDADAAPLHRSRIDGLSASLKSVVGPHVYLFLHLPDIDEPPREARCSTPAGIARRGSAWEVDPGLRKEWNRVISDRRVRGLFSGHFVCPAKAIYSSLRWVSSPDYLSASITKQYLAPPIGAGIGAREPLPAAIGFQDVRLDAGGAIDRRLHWHTGVEGGGGSFTSWPVTGQPGVSATALRAARALERADRLAEAEAAYKSTLESVDPDARSEALRGFERVVAQRSAWSRRTWVWTQEATSYLRPTVAHAALILLVLLVGRLARPFLGRRVIRVEDLSIELDGWSAEHLRSIVASVLQEMRYLSQQAPAVLASSKLPLMATNLQTSLGQLADLAPDPSGRFVAAALSWIAKPEYSLSASVAASQIGAHMVVCLHRDGSVDRVWEEYCRQDKLSGGLKDLSFKALMRVVSLGEPSR